MNLTAVKSAMADLYAAIAAPAEPGSGAAGALDADTLLDTVETTQQVINIAGGIQTHALAHLAAHDEVRDDEDESGWAWRRHGLGFTAEDTASLVAPRLGVSVPVAQGRVEDAVHQVSVTPRLVDVLGAGDLDLFRAHLVTREVMACRDDVARRIVDRLIEHYRRTGRWGETAGPLAARTRRLVARLAPEVAAARKEKAVSDRALTRRPVSDAADLWNGLVPVEQSLVMWQAVDQLARLLRRANPDLTLDQARLDALQQLVLGRADVTIHLHATHAEDQTSAETAGGDATQTDDETNADAESSADETIRDAASAATDDNRGQATSSDDEARHTESPDDEARHTESPDDEPTDTASRDEDPADSEWPVDDAGERPPQPGGLAARAVRGVVPVTGVLELAGLNRPGTTTVDLDRLPSCVRLVQSTPLGCHPDTGALTSGHVPKALAPCDLTTSVTDAVEARYRPSAGLQRLIRLRDGHCRFPGCPVPAPSCDLDHVIAWPAGATSAANLMLLCRRHHRVKQRPGWTVRLDPDGVVHWTDPGARTTDTHPVNHLDRVHQPAAPDPHRPATNDDPGADLRRPNAAAPVTVTHPPMPMPARTTGDPPRPDRLSRERLRTLIHSDPASTESLAELTLARLLDLARASTRGSPPTPADWYHQHIGELVDTSLSPHAEPPPADEPPPF